MSILCKVLGHKIHEPAYGIQQCLRCFEDDGYGRHYDEFYMYGLLRPLWLAFWSRYYDWRYRLRSDLESYEHQCHLHWMRYAWGLEEDPDFIPF
ncbi:MAG: hypothetical protein AAGJ95_13990 [Cyanobacteria bacterium J06554_11]